MVDTGLSLNECASLPLMLVLSFATLQLKALGAITVVFPMMNILAEHCMLDFKALVLVRATLSKSFTYKLTPFPAYILDPCADIDRHRHEQLRWGTLTMKKMFAELDTS